MPSSIVVVRASAAFPIARQNEQCHAAFGDVRATRWLRLQTAPMETLLATYRAIEETLDTGLVVTMRCPGTIAGDGTLTAMRTSALDVTVIFRPDVVTVSPPTNGSAAFYHLLAEHLDRLAWALRENRPLPHLPAALRPALPAGQTGQ
jgi:hypothetical protein